MDTPPLPRSAFVTALAWVFIALAGFGTLIVMLQAVMVWTILPAGQIDAAVAQARQQQQSMPAAAFFVMGHIREVLASMVVFPLGTLIISIGLLRRHNWARILFIGFLGLGIAWNIAAVVWQSFSFRFMPQPPQASAQVHAQIQTMFIVMGVVSGIMAIAMSVLFGWIIKRLTSRAIKSEFVMPTV